MAKVLIVYGTTEGQTAKIAEHLADAGRRLGHTVDVRHAPDVAADTDPARYDGVLVGASVHEGRYQRAVREFIERHSQALAARPSGFFSVSLAAASRDPAEREAIERIAANFEEGAGWAPQRTASFAGALKYTQYSWLKRALMKYISGKEGGDTDTSRDFEYTDWDAVTRFAEDFFGGLSAA
ncbi:MAG: menaquinone-dependent protoporphyrinogen IX dehydrogenase [Gammaproteobacteria bacterium]|nr:menaquinone-dependent protoporphyrinogen IX dehydrogenase [Gammaproteobacteria bacterium]